MFLFDADGNQRFNIDTAGRITSTNRLETLLPEEISDSLNTELRDTLTSDPSLSLSNAYQFNTGGHTVNVLVIQIPPTVATLFHAAQSLRHPDPMQRFKCDETAPPA
ncbi:hypothetical protein [Celeribacter sp.]|uniref:hypothetical protein n=1 Tax=Celeribacter sp. TaxID=1890673 RepID=UPI003A8F4ED5